VQVFELQDDRHRRTAVAPGADATEHLRCHVQPAVADLAWVLEDAAQMTAVLPVDAEQVRFAFREVRARRARTTA